MVRDITALGPFTRFAGELVLDAASDQRNQVWVTDGRISGTRRLTDKVSDARDFAQAGRHLVFFANAPTPYGRSGLWRSDGSDAGTRFVRKRPPRSKANLTGAGDVAFFTGGDNVHGEGLWETDGTRTGTKFVGDPSPIIDAEIAEMAPIGSRLFFAASDNTHGQELWVARP
jgi:ELWxxDGT repeat protein